MQYYIYFCNIQIKHLNIHLKRMKHTVVTCAQLLDAAQWRFVDAELNAMARRLPTVHGPRLYAVRVRVGDARCGGAQREAQAT